jgi:hypothetical protein
VLQKEGKKSNKIYLSYVVGISVFWHVAVMIQEQMQFHRAFGPAKFGPGKKR